MLFIFLFLTGYAVATAYRVDEDAAFNRYIDNLLSVHLPRAVENSGLNTYELPDFSFNVQDSSVEDEFSEGVVTFHSGHLRGLSSVHRKSCEHSSRSSGAHSVICNIVLPRVDVRYRGQYEVTSTYTSSYRDQVHRRDFYGEILARDLEAQIEVMIFDGDRSPSLKNLVLLGKGEVTKRFHYDDETEHELLSHFDVPFERIRGPFYQRVSRVFQEVFYGSYKRAFESALANLTYP
ncbi:uncharacterized protein NPIL_570751 [Nephila pilipes]|uniref:Secreted protein n=1 Tax=Nephila pilipes TaxID=299642 RepID=A0A8X6NIS2_NEPPI|nr:uncharacterized protein NPIL_238861 [Nephila pilipes]GFU00081.1 uncharacterized protein NPIL_570751 [Nephila pilipes]